MTSVPTSIRWAQGVLIFQIILCVLAVFVFLSMPYWDSSNYFLKGCKDTIQHNCPNINQGCCSELIAEPLISIVFILIILYFLRKPALEMRVPVGGLVILMIMFLSHLQLAVFLLVALLLLLAPNSVNYMSAFPKDLSEDSTK